MFKKVEPWIDFVQLEHKVLAFWEKEQTFNQLRAQNKNGQPWSFLDGPITANNPMGVHHAWGRTLKDTFQRYHAMNGKKQRYQNGFDCQGLWVEVEVEKQLGFKCKRDIETFGIEKFVELCRERVNKYSAKITEQSQRLGYWMDWDNSYYTMSDENNYTIWSFLKKCHSRGLVYRGYDVMPWCPRCGTGLSQHEMSEGYEEATHTSVVVRFPISGQSHTYLLVWTTTPWTLSSNVAAAVNPETVYVRAKQGEDTLTVAKNLAEKVLKTKGSFVIEAELKGKDLVGLKYVGPYDELPAQEKSRHEHTVVPWDEVSETDGTGLVHIAPGCGKEDFELGKVHGLSAICPINEDGIFSSGFGFLTGKHASSVADEVVADLKQKKVLYTQEKFKHSYPHCWRCKTELLFRLVNEWFISMDGWRNEIMEVTKQINWIPSYGRELELDWLNNMHDWMISKKRYWGLALPIWTCDDEGCGHFQVIGSKEELAQKAIAGWEQFKDRTPHRPWVDGVVLKCEKCGGSAHRVPDVGNPWLDAGIVPYSTVKYNSDRDYFKQWFPADLVLECFPGQFRNWFYSLLAMSTMMENKPPFRTLLGHALVRDEKGEVMHKSAGNAIWFEDAAEQMGVDVMRWIYCGQDPTINLNFGFNIAKEVRGGVFNTYWNTYSFFCNLAAAAGFVPGKQHSPWAERPEIDRWILAKLNVYIKTAAKGYEDCDTRSVVKGAEDFLENLSNWYIRLCRRRFWGDLSADSNACAAFTTLYECLETLTRIIAPMIPFLTEEIYQNLVYDQNGSAAPSVHLTKFPVAEDAIIDEALIAEMDAARRLTSLALAARESGKLKIRQPLSELVVESSDKLTRQAAQKFEALLLETLNIKALTVKEAGFLQLTYKVQPNYKTLGPRFGTRLNEVIKAINAANPQELKAQMDKDRQVSLVVENSPIVLEATDLSFNILPLDSYSTAADSKAVVAVNTVIDEALAREGLMRELLRKLQELRKETGLDISDRIDIVYTTDSAKLTAMLDTWGSYLRDELLGLSLKSSPTATHSLTILGEPITVTITKHPLPN